jgi:hypothetical protein
MKRLRFLAGGLVVAAAFGVTHFVDTPAAFAQAKAKMIEGKGTGTIKGKIALDGTAPAAKLRIDPNNNDASHCMKGDTEDLTWVSKDGGLGNVVVFLKAPAGSAFKVNLDNKTWEPAVAVDQPFCNFVPHVSVTFPEYDGKPTGQKFIIKNSAPITHNSRIKGGAFKNPEKNLTLAPKTEQPTAIKADTEVLKINCDVHKWMQGYVWAFNHPYAAVTAPDGTFEIKNVPTGVDVQVMAWHEVGAPNAGVEIKKGQLKDGDMIEAKIKKK